MIANVEHALDVAQANVAQHSRRSSIQLMRVMTAEAATQGATVLKS